MCGRRFELNEEVEWETEEYFRGFDKSYYLEGIDKFKDHWTRCIELKEEYNICRRRTFKFRDQIWLTRSFLPISRPSS